MAARVVIVHEEPVARAIADALVAAGITDIAHFSDPHVALDDFDRTGRLRLLITRIDFGAHRLHGVALARMLKHRRKDVEVIFAAAAEYAPHIDGLGELMPNPIDPAALAARAREKLRAMGEPAGS